MSNATLEFQQIHNTFRPKILRYLSHLVGEQEAEDLTQTVLINVNQGLKSFRGDAALSTWIYRIATNVALDRLRSASFQPPASLSPLATDNLAEGEPERSATEQTPSLEASLIREQMNACIKSFIDGLPENYRTVLVLSELEGFKNRETADILGLNLETVKIRLHRARQALKKKLDTGCDFYRDERNELACDRKRSKTSTT